MDLERAYDQLTCYSFCLMRGFFEPVESLLDMVEVYCAQSNENCEVLLFASDWVRGSTQLQLNDFTKGLHSFERGYSMLQRAVENGTITAEDDRIPIASGLMGNGCMAMNRFAEAERWYLKAFQMWETMEDDVFQDKQLFVSFILSTICSTNNDTDLQHGCLSYVSEKTTRSRRAAFA